jgi:hypothetical protein
MVPDRNTLLNFLAGANDPVSIASDDSAKTALYGEPTLPHVGTYFAPACPEVPAGEGAGFKLRFGANPWVTSAQREKNRPFLLALDDVNHADDSPTLEMFFGIYIDAIPLAFPWFFEFDLPGAQ